ncbi:retrovirus-related pol polyprotein from transposon TNT 1-94 [Tanacetum coccineum]
MYRLTTSTTQTRTPQLPEISRNTNPHVSISTGINHSTSVSRPQLKSNKVKDKVLPNNSQVKFKGVEVEDHHRISSNSKKTNSVTACNNSLNSRTTNDIAVCADYGQCLFDSNYAACVSRYLNDVNARTKKPKVVPISDSKPKRKANKSVATPHKKIAASDTTIQKYKSYYKKLYKNTTQTWKWWIAKKCPSGYKWTQKPPNTKKIWMPKIKNDDVSISISPFIDNVSRITNIVQLILFIVDSGCTKHMTGNLKLLCNFVERFLGTVRFGNDQFAPILGYGDLIQGNVTIKRVYYVEGPNHNLFSGNDLLTGNRGSNLYTISLQATTSSTPICFMAKASPTQAWLWHRRLSHLNFDYINLISKKDVVNGLSKLKYVKDQLCSSCEMSKAKKKFIQVKVASINEKKYILVIVDDYSRYTWTLFLRSKDETSEVLKDFLTMIQRNLQAQNGIVKRQNRTLVEAAQTMLSASKLPLSFWVEAVATACYTQNRSIIISTHGKMAYHIINDRKPTIKHLHIFGCICYLTRDGENLDKMKEKGDPYVMVGYSTQSKGYHVYNKRTRLIVESIHINFDEIKEMIQNVVPIADKTGSSQQELEFLFNPLFEEYYTLTHVHAERNNNDQAANESSQQDEFINPLCTLIQDMVESSSRNIDNINMHSFQLQSYDYRWTKDHPLEQVIGNPSNLVQTRQQLATDP